MTTATLAAIRFGTGLAPALTLPADSDSLLAALTGQDTARVRFPVAGAGGDLAADGRIRRRPQGPLRGRGRGRGHGSRRPVTRFMQRGSPRLRARLLRAVHAPDGFRERLTWFWADHFTVRSK